MFFFLELSEAKNLWVVPYHVPIKPCIKPKHGRFCNIETDHLRLDHSFWSIKIKRERRTELHPRFGRVQITRISWPMSDSSWCTIIAARRCTWVAYHADCDSESISVSRWWRIPDSDFVRHGTVREGSAVTGFKTWSERSSCPQTGWATWQTHE